MQTHPRLLVVRRAAVASAGLWLALAAAASAQSFTFAGYAWDQSDTPDIVVPLTPGVYSDAVITAEPISATGTITFPDSQVGFDPGLSLGRKLGYSGSASRGINLPAGNFGTAARSGVQASWTLGRKLRNQAGADFVVYESATNAASPEGMMVQVRSAATTFWSRWRYQLPDDHALYPGEPVEGAFVYAFDLEAFGVGTFDEIDAVRIANLTDEDRIDGPGTEITPGVFTGSGFVLPEDAGATSVVLPDPGPAAGYDLFGNSSLDPDPLYIGSLVEAQSCGDNVLQAGEECDDGNVADLDGCSSLCRVEAQQSKIQQRCLNAINIDGSRVADVKARATMPCLRNAANGSIGDAQACVETEDARLQKVRARTGRTIARLCTQAPDFGELNPTTVNDAAVDETIALVAELFGADLQAAVADRLGAPETALCQSAVLGAANRLARAERVQFRLCKKAGLKAGTIRAGASLAACLDEIVAAPRPAVFRAQTRLQSAVSGCVGVNLGVALPGACSAAVDVPVCLAERVACRICRMFNGMDALTRDCDEYDDGVRNASCPLS